MLATLTQPKTGGYIRCSGRVSRSWDLRRYFAVVVMSVPLFIEIIQITHKVIRVKSKITQISNWKENSKRKVTYQMVKSKTQMHKANVCHICFLM